MKKLKKGNRVWYLALDTRHRWCVLEWKQLPLPTGALHPGHVIQCRVPPKGEKRLNKMTDEQIQRVMNLVERSRSKRANNWRVLLGFNNR